MVIVVVVLNLVKCQFLYPSIQQVQCYYSAPTTSLSIGSSGFVTMPYSYGTSDQRIKASIKTMDNTLWKVQQLRGIEYNDIK